MSKSNNKAKKSDNKSKKSDNKSKSKNESADKLLSLKDMFNFKFMVYLLMVTIPVTLFFNTVFSHSEIGDMVSLFIITGIVTGAVLYFTLRDKKQTIEKLGDKSAIIFVVFIGFASLFLLLRRMFQENIYTLNGAVYFALFVLILVTVYNFAQILIGIS